MELIPAPLRGAVMELLRQEVAVVATVHVRLHRFIHAVNCRSDVQVIPVTEGTRDALPSNSRTAGPHLPRRGR